jgi:division protein CdvB (Snf7/Vps24/ESCRT-III family)
MNQLPIFISLDVVDDDRRVIPVAIAWSLPDGQIKATLIQPDQDWEIDAISLGEIDLETMYDQGATPAEIVTEMNLDFDENTVFCFDEYQDIPGLDTLFDAINDEAGFEVASWLSAFKGATNENIFETANWISELNNLDLSIAEDRVKKMLLSFNELQN